MYIDDVTLKSEELVVLKLRNIYQKFGYSCFKMSKFEEYDLYSRNKDFLVSEGVITFNDTNGKLMALKPDVTLSIVKNYKDSSKNVERVYYNENVYRISDKNNTYKEIMQTGIECIGSITDYDIYEVVALAEKSLAEISGNSVLCISDLRIISEAAAEINDESLKRDIIRCVNEKNVSGTYALCEAKNISPKTAKVLAYLAEGYGDAAEVLGKLRRLTDNRNILAAADNLEKITKSTGGESGMPVRVDLSLINDINYYSGIVFQGFVEGIPTRVLSGGEYSHLMQKMNIDAKAIGFAVYLDLLERMKMKKQYDVDLLLIYKESDSTSDVFARADEIVRGGRSVSVNMAAPAGLSYRETEDFSDTRRAGNE